MGKRGRVGRYGPYKSKKDLIRMRLPPEQQRLKTEQEEKEREDRLFSDFIRVFVEPVTLPILLSSDVKVYSPEEIENYLRLIGLRRALPPGNSSLLCPTTKQKEN